LEEEREEEEEEEEESGGEWSTEERRTRRTCGRGIVTFLYLSRMGRYICGGRCRKSKENTRPAYWLQAYSTFFLRM
jgi:hypothetical protein